MLKLTLEYVDFDGQKKVKDLFFNISLKTLVEKEMRSDGTWFETLNAISEANKKNEASGDQIMDKFHEIIGLAYGVRTEEDGEIYFRQSLARFENFEATAAYDAFFMKICTDANYAATFINAVLPQELLNAAKAQALKEAAAAEVPVVEIPTQQPAPEIWPPQA